MPLPEIALRLVATDEEARYQQLMGAHHYLGALPKIGRTLWYVAVFRDQWLALLGFSAAALKCAARDEWIGWDFRHQYDRLHLVANNSRFLILPDYHYHNLASRVLSLAEASLRVDWPEQFGYRLLLLETFVDPTRFHGTIYRAANWLCLGRTKGYRRVVGGYEGSELSPKLVFARPLIRRSLKILSAPSLDAAYQQGESKIMISAAHMYSLPEFFGEIHDPRRTQGRRHSLPTVLAIAAAATMCGMRGYKAISGWAQQLGPKARERFHCRRVNGKRIVPGSTTIRDVLVRVDPDELDRALEAWNQQYGVNDESLAIDGKTMRQAVDEQGRQVHIMSAVGHQSLACRTQKK